MKKCVIILFVIFAISCTKEAEQVNLPRVTWIDEGTRSDTIITKYSSELKTIDAMLYYARLNWQQSTSSTPMMGYRQMAVLQGDSMLLIRNDNSGSYDGPYLFKFSADGQQLTSQDFLVEPANSQGRVFVRLQ